MDVVQKFYDVDYHSSVFYTIVEGKRVYFEEEAIKKLYKFPVVRMKGWKPFTAEELQKSNFNWNLKKYQYIGKNYKNNFYG